MPRVIGNCDKRCFTHRRLPQITYASAVTKSVLRTVVPCCRTVVWELSLISLVGYMLNVRPLLRVVVGQYPAKVDFHEIPGTKSSPNHLTISRNALF